MVALSGIVTAAKTAGPAVASLLGGALSGAGSLANSFLSFEQQKELIKMQQDWQEYMSSSAHQREVQDLLKAGLNPVLSATGGSGASYGSVSSPTANFNTGIPEAVQTAMEIRQLNQNLAKQDQEISLMNDQASNIRQQKLNSIQQIENETKIAEAQVEELISRKNANNATAFRALNEGYTIQNRLPYSALERELWNSDLGRFLFYTNEGLDTLGKGTGAIGNVVGLGKGLKSSPKPYGKRSIEYGSDGKIRSYTDNYDLY